MSVCSKKRPMTLFISLPAAHGRPATTTPQNAHRINKTGGVLLCAGDVHGEPGAGDGDALPRAAHDPSCADAADPQERRQGSSVIVVVTVVVVVLVVWLSVVFTTSSHERSGPLARGPDNDRGCFFFFSADRPMSSRARDSGGNST